METLNVLQITDLISVKPVQPSCVKVFVQLSNLNITKPQQVYSSIAAEARTEPVAGPAHQWEKSRGEREGQTRLLGQWEKRDVQKSEQRAQIGLERKPLGLSAQNCFVIYKFVSFSLG